eukprot:CAMPEP_0195526954 /NCGR_PEP_ID=MMETSP0794_2-20130614/28311_1 /TAXON_ID=515487 /ORGANISM="Stephanopyxis turris, Strain CCMP 815" /LENGTH=285 /DNA_ID=CAMNT_0040657751 /DNA_START=50 /DNA_END=907 /DNA_ORIENTATION=+
MTLSDAFRSPDPKKTLCKEHMPGITISSQQGSGATDRTVTSAPPLFPDVVSACVGANSNDSLYFPGLLQKNSNPDIPMRINHSKPLVSNGPAKATDYLKQELTRKMHTPPKQPMLPRNVKLTPKTPNSTHSWKRNQVVACDKEESCLMGTQNANNLASTASLIPSKSLIADIFRSEFDDCRSVHSDLTESSEEDDVFFLQFPQRDPYSTPQTSITNSPQISPNVEATSKNEHSSIIIETTSLLSQPKEFDSRNIISENDVYNDFFLDLPLQNITRQKGLQVLDNM